MIPKSQYEYDALGSTDTTSALYPNQFAYNPKNEITNAVMPALSGVEGGAKPYHSRFIEMILSSPGA